MLQRPPRFADAPRRGLPPASAEEVGRRQRLVAAASSLLLVWGLAGSLALLAAAVGVSGLALGLALALPAAIVGAGLLALDLRSPSASRSNAAAASGSVALVGAVAGHALHHGQAWLLLPWALPSPFGLATLVAILLLVPLYAGARMRALALAWRASGSLGRGPRTLAHAVAAEDDLLARASWSRVWIGAARRHAEGLSAPGRLLLDVVTGALRRPADRIHAEAPLGELALALGEAGARVELGERELRVLLADASPLRLSVGRTLFPAGPTLEVRGEPDVARRLRRLLDGVAAHALLLTWSAPARRWERRLNALRREARVASTLEERSLVLEELDRVQRALAERELCGEDFAILALKEQSARAFLAHRMLGEPPGARGEARVLAHHAALAPQLSRVMQAGGLHAARRLAFVPFWIVPVATVWGEQEVAVSAATGVPRPEESRALLATMDEAGPGLFLDVSPQATFLPAPAPSGALARALREAGFTVAAALAAGRASPDLVYVPYLATAEGYTSGITGAAAPDLGDVPSLAAAGSPP